jgi:phospholipid/cholesterol/gamma-HCH transport system substrate-binding protein
MDTYSDKFKARLGFFITGGIALFIIAIFLIGRQQNLFNPVFKITATFSNVSGLKVGNNVRFSGINVGVVDNIKILNDTTVSVEMLIRKDVQQFLKSDSEASIGSSGIIGDRIIMIAQGGNDSPIVEDGQRILSKEPIEPDAIIESLQFTSGHVEVVAQELAEILINLNSGQGMLGRLLQDSTMAENVNQTVANFKKSSEGLDQTIESMRINMVDFMNSLQVTAEKTEVASNQLGEIMMKINQGEGTIGMLVQDTVFAGNLNQTLVNMKEGTESLNENLEALKHNFLFRAYFKRQAREEEKQSN